MVAAILNGVIGLLMNVLNVILAPLNLIFNAVPGLNLLPDALSVVGDMIGFFPTILTATTGIPSEVYSAIMLGYVALMALAPTVSAVKSMIRLVRGM